MQRLMCASHLPSGPAGFFMMEAVGYGDLHSWCLACLNNMGVVYTYLTSSMHFALLLTISDRLVSLGAPKVLHEPHISGTPRCTVNLAWQPRFHDTDLHYSFINLICLNELALLQRAQKDEFNYLSFDMDSRWKEGIIAHQHTSHSSNVNALK